ncbi:MAG: hypothetical protein U9R51_00905 [Actinomycetota bacterium]|nr:hypothetical protein [Actinomycetota bacterium]
MATDHDGFNTADLARHIARLMMERTGRIWPETAIERLAVWLVDSANRSEAVKWLVFIDETEGHLLDPIEEFALRESMVEVLTGERSEGTGGFVGRRRYWWPPRR